MNGLARSVAGLIVCTITIWAAAPRLIVDSYRRQVNSLDITRPESVCLARNSLKTIVLEANQTDRTEAFRMFRAFYIQSVLATGPAFLRAMSRYTSDYEQWLSTSREPALMQAFLKARPDIANAGSRWFDCGFSMYEGEGNLYPSSDQTTLLKFADILPSDLAAYIRFRTREDVENVTDDFALQITWEQLRHRLERWERFEKDHPSLPETQSEVRPAIRELALMYLFGVDNSPTFDFSTGRLNSELIASWRSFVIDDRSSRYHPLLAGLLNHIVDENEKIGQSDRPLFERFGFATEFDRWEKLMELRLSENGEPTHY